MDTISGLDININAKLKARTVREIMDSIIDILMKNQSDTTIDFHLEASVTVNEVSLRLKIWEVEIEV